MESGSAGSVGGADWAPASDALAASAATDRAAECAARRSENLQRNLIEAPAAISERRIAAFSAECKRL